LQVAGFEVVQVAAAAALRPGGDWVVPCQLDLALCLALGTSPLDVMLGTFPLVCLVEDLASALPYAEHANASPAARAEGYGLAAETIDGGDFEAALAAFQRAVARAQAKGGPTLIHAVLSRDKEDG